MSTFIRDFLYTYTETTLGGLFIYFVVASFQYFVWFIWYKEKYLKYLDNKRTNPKSEIYWSLVNVTVQGILVSLIRVALKSRSKLYYNISDYSASYFVISFFMTLTFTEFFVYWVHRLEHDIPFLYRHFHYIHHEYVIITPYCGWAFHPLDAFAQALPMLVVPFLFPVYSPMHVIMTLFLSVWGISIHDNLSFIPSPFILYAAHHTIHHDKGRRKNYGQFTTFWDRVFGTYQHPEHPMPFKEDYKKK